ncbi:DUF2079 domain-containing protein [Streptomyces sp. 6N223]|uniref:DUF2079 domain-containing protein n=1 Tax=Streptomyces sp. 6N223 TaxID=3457412 RepID=UPI003FD3A82A
MTSTHATDVPGDIAPAPTRARDAAATGQRRARREPYLLAAAFFVLYAVLSITRYFRDGARSWDLGIFEQVVRSYAHLEAPVADLKGPGFAILGDHFSPVTALLAPFYRVFPSPLTLLIAQAALFALAVVPVTRGATALLGRGAGAAIGVAYGLSWGVQRAVDFDFHEICFAVPLIAFALEAVVRQRWRAALCWALPLLLVKEDLGLTAAAIAVIVAVRARRCGQARVVPVALGVACACAVTCAITLGLVIPAFNSGGEYDYWTKLGEGGGPADAVFSGAEEKVRTLLWVVVPTTGLLALRSPLLIALLPTLAWRFVSAEPHYWGTDWHYSAVLMPVTALALADAVALTRASHRAWLRRYAHHLPACALAAALALSTTLPVAALTRTDSYRAGTEEAAGVLDRIPDDAEVAANIRPISHLTGRCRVFWIGNTYGPAPGYIAYYDPLRSAESLLAYADSLRPGVRYEVLAEDGGYWVLRAT